jgi:hypothetical protein
MWADVSFDSFVIGHSHRHLSSLEVRMEIQVHLSPFFDIGQPCDALLILVFGIIVSFIAV